MMAASDDEVLQQLGSATRPEAEPTPELPEGTELPYRLHCTASDGAVMVCGGQILSYGDELVVDQRMVDREGASAVRVIELVEDRSKQRALFGSVRLRRGGWPTGIDKVLIGSRAWEMSRTAAYSAADRVEDDRFRETALAVARDKYGARVGTPPFEPAYGMIGYEGPEQ